MTAPSQRQSSEIFIKLLAELQVEHEKLLEAAGGFKAEEDWSTLRTLKERRAFELEHGIYKEIPTKTSCFLKNGSIIYCLPAGKTGIYLRTFALDVLIIDEAAYVPEMVYTALKPMLAISEKERGMGWEYLLSTPFGKGGFFYDACFDDDFKHFHVSSEKCSRISKKFLAKERRRLSKIEYAQEWQAEFTDEFQQLFPTALIKKCMTFMHWPYSKNYTKNNKYYLGVDIARWGADENAFVILEMTPQAKCRIVKVEVTQRKSLTDTAARVLNLDAKWNFSKIFTDDTGVGGGVTDILTDKLGKRRVFGINNATRSIEFEDKKKRIMKEDLYSNASVMMEQGKIEIIDNLKLLKSLRSMTFEYTLDGNLRIKGKYSHLAEAYVRACWALKEKGLNIFLY